MVLSRSQIQQDLADTEVFADFVERWIPSNRVTRLAPKTQDDYAYKLFHYACPHLGEIPLSALTRQDVEHLVTAMRDRELSPSTQQGVLAVVSMMLKTVQEDTGIPNVASDVKVVNHEPPRATSMDEGQAKAYGKALSDDQLDCVLRIMLETGARPGEALGLKREDLRLSGAQPSIFIRRAVARSKSSANEKVTKSRKRRSVDISPRLGQRLLQAAEDTDGEWLFSDDEGLPFWHSTLRDRHFATLKAAGIHQHFRLYDLRHTHATLLLLAATPPKVVSERLGHASVAFTMQVYAHVLPSMQAGVPQVLDDLLDVNEGDDEEDE